jgi:DNA-binding transcriptional LysR family regulator
VLSDAGRALFPFAKEAFELIKKADSALSRHTRSVKGMIQLGAIPMIGEYILPRLLALFREEFNHVSLNVKKLNTIEIQSAVLNHQLVLGLVKENIEHPDIHVEPLLNDEFVLIMSRNHPLAQKAEIEPRDILPYPFIFEKNDRRSREKLTSELRSVGIEHEPLQVILELDTPQQIVSAVESEQGLSIISRWSIRNEEKWNLIKSRQIRGVSLAQPIFAVYLKHVLIPMSAVTLLTFIKGINLGDMEQSLNDKL